MDATTLKNLIEQGLTDCTALVETFDDVHFTATIISPEFKAKNRVQKQQLVYATICKQLADGSIHALSLKTFTPEEWSTNKGV
jgi:acid stress-induced BolA-like protein IbaG/YrbA